MILETFIFSKFLGCNFNKNEALVNFQAAILTKMKQWTRFSYPYIDSVFQRWLATASQDYSYVCISIVATPFTHQQLSNQMATSFK